MWPLQVPYLKVAGAVLVALACASLAYKFWSLSSELKDTKLTLEQVRVDYKVLEGNFLHVTQASDNLLKATKDAQAERDKIQADLNLTLKKLRNQKPPVECKAAIDWAVQNKDDLKW